MHQSQLEVEVKILEIDQAKVIATLHAVGAKMLFEGEISADFFRNDLGMKLRLRQMGDQNILTYKVAHLHPDVLQNTEVEVVCDTYEGMKQILLAAGFVHYGHSEKYRVSYQYQDIHFDIDTMVGIPPFVEVEAATLAFVKKGVELLGYSMEQTSKLTERGLKEYYQLT